MNIKKYNSKVITKKSKSEGFGIFTDKNFKKDELVFVFSGKIVNWQKANYQSLQIGKNKFINPYKNNPGVYLNNSCNPNCFVKYPNKITSIKNIKKGEEITIDYSTTVGTKKWKMECLCKSKNCRKIVEPYLEISDKLKNKYKNHTSEYLLQ